jgi:tRNA modification GTPase
VLIDTAGLREARDEIEVEGIRRSHQSLAGAEIVLHVLDASEPLTSEDEVFLATFAAKKRILIRNKMDLPSRLELPPINAPIVSVCSLTGHGVEDLKDAVKNLVWSGQINAEMLQVMINSRHQDALNRARESLRLTLDALRADVFLDLVAVDLHAAVRAVGEVVGQTSTEDLLDKIFSQFCLGK